MKPGFETPCIYTLHYTKLIKKFQKALDEVKIRELVVEI